MLKELERAYLLRVLASIVSYASENEPEKNLLHVQSTRMDG